MLLDELPLTCVKVTVLERAVQTLNRGGTT